MKLAILSRNAKLYSTRRLVEAARVRGHSVRILDPLRCYLRISSDGFDMHYKGAPITDYHAVVVTCDLSDACTLQTLPIELARSGDAAKAAFEQALAQVVATLVEGPPCVGAPHDLPSAYAALSTLIGAVTLARAVATPEVAAAMAQAAECALLGRAARE